MPCPAEAHEPPGVPLTGGTANFGRVFRVGNTVHRPRGKHTDAVHDLLIHLERVGFAGSPRVVSPTPSTEIEVLEFIDGEVPHEPLPPWLGHYETLQSVGALLSGFHRSTPGFSVNGRRWQREVPPAWRGPLIAHNDVHPSNVVFRDRRAVALIDFDLAAPATPAWDLAVTACLWVPLRADQDLDVDQRSQRRERFAILLDGYGADPAMARAVTAALPDANRWIARVIKDNARNGHPAFGRAWASRQKVHTRAGAWLAAHAVELTPQEKP